MKDFIWKRYFDGLRSDRLCETCIWRAHLYHLRGISSVLNVGLGISFIPTEFLDFFYTNFFFH